MSNGSLATVLRHLRTLVNAQAARDLTDAELLERFCAQRDEAAFALLVQRHGPMVLGVCRRMLHNPHDAEDAFQATFLVLVRSATAIRKRQSLASWLYGVAQRTALKARTQAASLRAREKRSAAMERHESHEPPEELTWQDLRPILDEELGQLPESYRAPLVLCYLEGKTSEQAARDLGVPRSTLSGRLARGREILGDRLARRGITLTGGLLAALLIQKAASAAIPAVLTLATVRAATLLLSGKALAAGLVSSNAIELAQGVTKGMGLTNLKIVAVLLLLAGALMAGGGAVALLLAAEPPAPTAREQQPEASGPRAPDTGRPPPLDRHGDPLPAGAVARWGTIRFRQGGVIHSLLPCPDGKTLLSNSRAGDRAICLWEFSTGKLLRQFPGTYSGVAVALSPDGKTLALVEDNDSREIVLVEVSSGKKVGQLTAPREVSGFAFSPDGKTLAEAGDHHLILWDLVTKKEISRLPVGRVCVSLLAFTPNGKTLISADPLNAPLRVWDVATGNELPVQGGSRAVRWFALSTDGATLAAAEMNGTVSLWDLATRRRVRALQPKHKIVWAVAFSPDGKTLAAGGTGDPDSGEDTISLWNVATGRELRAMMGHPWGTERLVFSTDGRTLVSGSGDSTIRLWDVATGKEFGPSEEGQRPVTVLALSGDGKTLAAAGGKVVRLLDPATGKDLGTLSLRGEPDVMVWSLAISADGQRLAAGTTRDIRVWDLRTRKLVGQMEGHKHRVNALAYSPDGGTLASASYDSTIRMWEVASGKELRQIPCGKMESVAFSPDGKTLVAAERVRGGEQIWVWDAATGKERGELKAAVNKWPKFDADLGAGAPDYIWFTRTDFSPDGKLLAVTRRLETIVQVFDAASGKEQCRLRGHEKPVICFAFSPDGQTVATAGWDYTIRLWDLATGKQLHQLAGHRGKVNALTFLPDGKTLLSGGDDTTVLAWDVARIMQRK